ncbi:MAG: DNA-processing protein DprA [Gammaproteobacteria bacterium]
MDQAPDHHPPLPLPHPAPWLALYRAPGIGPARFAALIERFGSPAAVLRADAARLGACGLKQATLEYLAAPDWAAVERDLTWLGEPGHRLVTLGDANYPPLLREIAASPPLLFVRGALDCLQRLQLAVVGSRNPTAGGRQHAAQFAAALVDAGLAVTSGLALGVDGAGHRGALGAGGVTLAVLGSGLDRVYPARHQGLADEIVAAGGALVSEFPPGTRPAPEHFPRRNRVISGLSLGTLVVEAAPRSGSLITARHALEQGREVFAIPGSIHNPLARGCHRLIRDGAKLVETVDDVLAEIGTLAGACRETAARAAAGAPGELEPRQQQVLEALGYEPASVDLVVERCGLTADEVSSILLTLELRGLVASSPGGTFNRALT